MCACNCPAGMETKRVLSRRSLLQQLAFGAVGAIPGSVSVGATSRTTATLGLQERPPAPADGEVFNVVVVGGGVSGVYVAWRLQTANPSWKVAVCEMSERIGGRLYSIAPPGMPHLRAELGGMRFRNSQLLVAKLIEHLGLIVDPFPSGDTRNLLYLRGKRFTQGDWKHAERVPYALTNDGPVVEVGKSPDELQRALIELYAPDAAEFSSSDWDTFKKEATVEMDGQTVPLHQLGFWNLMQRVLSGEAYQLIHDAGGYTNVRGNWNAAEALPWLWADVVGEALHRLRDGYQELPLELARRFQDAGGAILQPYRLRTVERAAGPTVQLEFERGPDRQPWTCAAENTVLAMPRRALQLLDQGSFLFESQQFRDDMDVLIPQLAAKAFLGYDEPWWTEQFGLQSGHSVTDLPMRQCFYFGTEGDQAGADPGNRNALLMADYYAGDAHEFWPGYPSSPLFPVPAAQRQIPLDVRTPQLMVDELQRQLIALHGPAARVPAPHLAMFMDWGADPYGAGWHFWPTGAKSWEIIPRVRQPVPGANVYVCGEAWSTTQGWVEGALQTAEQVLQQKFGLTHPRWLPTDANLGP
ncbi:MAG: putative monoamine oxidase [Propionibacteriaceae bacterium]|nr:putative monoamine oxidase [Propionibacteriaceae bacterium]